MAGSKVLWQAICIFLLFHSTTAQDLETTVMCFTSGGGCPQGSGNMTTYTACCTGDDLSNVANTMYQVNGGVCTTCGPVIDLTSVIVPRDIRAGSMQTVFLQWALANGSLPALSYPVTVTNQQENGVVLPGAPALTTSFQFLNLMTGVNYRFTIRAIGISGDPSLPAVLDWRAGEDSALPRFVNFNVTGMDESSVTASWTLETPGFIPPGEIESLEEMTVRWVLASDSLVITSSDLITLNPNSLQFPEENIYVRTFGSDDLAQSGRMFNLTFEDLKAESRYIVQIEGVNSLGSSLTFFAFDTFDAPAIIILELLPGSAASTQMSLSLLLLATTAALVIKNLLL